MPSTNLQKLTPKKDGGRGYSESTPWMAAFLEVLSQTGNVSFACRSAQISRQTAYDAREKDAEFAAQWENALEEAVELLELEARRRALDVSDTLMIFLLKAHRPERYRERYEVTLTKKPDKPLEAMTDAELQEYEDKLRSSVK